MEYSNDLKHHEKTKVRSAVGYLGLNLSMRGSYEIAQISARDHMELESRLPCRQIQVAEQPNQGLPWKFNIAMENEHL